MRAKAGANAAAHNRLWRFADPSFYVQHLHVPVALSAGRFVIAAGELTPENHAWLKAHYGDGAQIVACDRRLVLSLIEKRFRAVLTHAARSELIEREPEFSASATVTRGQKKMLALLFGLLTLAFCIFPRACGAIFTMLLAILFIVNGLFRVLLFLVGAGKKSARITRVAAVPDSDLPTYTILVPLYREAHMVPSLMRALSALHYPKERLDIKLIVELDDDETVQAAEAAAIDPHFSVVRVPPGSPRTKPRACNYALPLALGEFTVIFDAEDRPEPDQLRKAVAAFRALPDSVACLQARLNFYNANENWLTALFALDYALWFDYLLLGLDRLNMLMPLGGTSNHFRTTALRTVRGWDPYNVTEDADLGIRLMRLKFRVRVLDSTTFEEATSCIGPWLLQRSRWLKGYMQTWLVHMRSPRALLRDVGIVSFVGFQIFIAGTFLSALLNPILWGLFLILQIAGITAPDGSQTVTQASLFGLAIGNLLFVCLAVVSPARRGWFTLAPYGLTSPFYWLLVSLAGFRALFQLFARPWHWDKTPHGLSRTSFSKVDR